MNEDILEESKKFLFSYLKDKSIEHETIHPWRKSWESVVLHCLRVEGYVKKILACESHDLSDEEILITRLAAIVHDIGKIPRRDGHALIGRNIIHDWLRENKTITKSMDESNRLLYLIEKHSDKEDDDEDYCLKVLRDADVLDEIGVMSIFMTSNWIDKSNPYFFKLLSDRIENFEINFCENGLKLLNTKSAKMILEEKIQFITLFNNQLKDELYGTEMLGQVNIEDYFGDVL